MKQVLADFKTMATWLFASVALAAFIFAGVSYASGENLRAIATTGVLAMALLVVQTMDRNTLRPRAWPRLRDWLRLPIWLRSHASILRIAWNTLIVGVAIHYSAIIIGVSFGTVFSAEGNVWEILAVLVKQAVLTRAAWVLVNEYRQSNAGKNRKP